MKSKVYGLRVRGQEFKGAVELAGLVLDLEGSFDVKFHDQYPSIANLYIDVANNTIDAMTHGDLIDFDTLVVDILETDDGSWYDEHVASIQDRSRKMGEDR